MNAVRHSSPVTQKSPTNHACRQVCDQGKITDMSQSMFLNFKTQEHSRYTHYSIKHDYDECRRHSSPVTQKSPKTTHAVRYAAKKKR